MVKNGIFYLVLLKGRLTAGDLPALCEPLVPYDCHEHRSDHAHDDGGDVHLHLHFLPQSVLANHIVNFVKTAYDIPATEALLGATPASFSSFFTPPA